MTVSEAMEVLPIKVPIKIYSWRMEGEHKFFHEFNIAKRYKDDFYTESVQNAEVTEISYDSKEEKYRIVVSDDLIERTYNYFITYSNSCITPENNVMTFEEMMEDITNRIQKLNRGQNITIDIEVNK